MTPRSDFLKKMLLLSLFLLASCDQAENSSSHPFSEAAQKQQLESTSLNRQEETMSALEGLLLKFVSVMPVRWDAFNAVSGVRWRDGAPVKNDEASDAQSSYYRRGTLLLAGFGMVEVPDGDQGADEGARQANEGNSGITLNGDADQVYSIAVQKFYASEDYRKVLRSQLTSSDKVSLVAGQCQLDFGTSSPNTLGNQFFLITLSSGKVYVEAYADDGAESHGPGSTTFIFYLSKPMQRIAAMQCKESQM